MKTCEFQIISAFTDAEAGLRGNPAAVVLLSKPLEPRAYQSIAADLNQPATTFLWPSGTPGVYKVRWFAPDAEIDLCGHGSLAALAFLQQMDSPRTDFELQYNTGSITGTCSENACTIALAPIEVMSEQPAPPLLEKALGIPVKGYFPTLNKHIVLTDSAKAVKTMQPNFPLLRKLPVFGYAVTAPDEGKFDFVSRTLVPHVGQLEDFATGSSHAALMPFWSRRLNKVEMTALQASSRGGKFFGAVSSQDIKLSGEYEKIAEGILQIPA